MKAFTKINGLACPLDRANVDTDAIIPKQFLKSIKRSGITPFVEQIWTKAGALDRLQKLFRDNRISVNIGAV